MKKQVLSYIIWLAAGAGLFAQNRAPSCWLTYQANYPGDIIINTLRVAAPSPTYTYYCAMQWNAGGEGGGYCGIQEHPDGRNYIYSIWDPLSSDEAITAAYRGEGTEVENFGGEGTGLKSWNFALGWETGRWYSFVSRAWDRGQHTMFGFWVYDHGDSLWHHLVTMDFPVEGVRFNTSTGSFIEDWYGNGWEQREVHHRQAWKRRVSDKMWFPLTQAYFRRVSPDDGAANYIDNYDGGVGDGYLFMKSGGTTTPATNTSGTWLTLSNNASAPPFSPPHLDRVDVSIDGDSLSLSWATDSAGAPQFACQVSLYDNASLEGTPLLSRTDTLPHVRTAKVSLEGVPRDAVYYLRFSVTGIFDRSSDIFTDTLVYGSPAGIRHAFLPEMTLFPNPATRQVYLTFGQPLDRAVITLTGPDGRQHLRREVHHATGTTLLLPPLHGICYVTITTEKGHKTLPLLIR